MNRYMCTFLLGAALVIPIAVRADDDDHRRDRDQKRYYDSSARDYHQWNDKEDQAYRHYLQEQHRDYHDFDKAKRKEQKEYFKWRHNHPDSDDHDRH
jgi:hypothetical protein